MSIYLPDGVRDSDPNAPWNRNGHCGVCGGCADDARCNPADHDTCEDHKIDRSDCCGARATYMDDGRGDWVLCCKKCYSECNLQEQDHNNG